MAGASFKAELDDTEARHLFAEIKARGLNPRPVLNEIGSVLEQSTRDRFKTERGPDGVKWAPISREWSAEKASRGQSPGILKMTGELSNRIYYELVGDSAVEIIESAPYAAIHQFGGTIRPKRKRALKVRGRVFASVTIPARPSLGVSAEDRSEIIDAVRDFLDRSSRR